MSQWLKWRLIALFCAVALSGGATYLHAQSGYAPPAKTPEEAAEKFAQAMAIRSEGGTVNHAPFGSVRSSDWDAETGLISRRNYETLGSGLPNLLRVFIELQRLPQFSGRAVSNDGQSAVVEVSPTTPKPLPLVVVAEDGGWRVDVIATYAKLTKLQGQELDNRLLRITGKVPQGFPSSENMRRATCQSNLKQIMLGIIQYSNDYDEKYPPARKWTDVLQPYVKTRQIFTCPSLPQGRENGYAFNQNLSQLPEAKIFRRATTISVYETSNLGANAFGPGTGRAYRHIGGANYAFADGHVKWLMRGNDASAQFKP